MSVAVVPATPRRSVLHAHPQGLNTAPAFAPFGLDKSPSIRAALNLQHGQRASDHHYQDSMMPSRPLLLHKQSHPPLIMQTPIASLPTINIMEQTATAPARLPAGGSHAASKRQRAADSEGHELNEEEEYRRQQEEAAAMNGGQDGSSRHPAKRARHSPHPPAMSAAAMTLRQYAAEQDDDDDLIIVGGSNEPPSRTIRPTQLPHATLKRSRPVASPLRPGTAVATEPSAKKAKVDKRAVDRERLERERFEERFRDKYTRAFPQFKFYFDSVDAPAKASLVNRVQQLGAVRFFFFDFVTLASCSHRCHVCSALKISFLHLLPISLRTNQFLLLKTSLFLRTRKTLLILVAMLLALLRLVAKPQRRLSEVRSSFDRPSRSMTLL